MSESNVGDVQFRGVMPKEIEAAFVELLLAGKNPTIENIRLHLGRGSPNTITKHRAAFLARVAESRTIALPAPIPEAAANVMAQMWGLISAEAFAKYTTEVDAAKAESQLAKDEAQALASNAKLDAERTVEAIKAQLQQAEQYVLALKEDAAKKDLRIGHLMSSAEALKAENQALKRDAILCANTHEEELKNLQAAHQEHAAQLTALHQARLTEELERRAEISSSYSAMLKRETDVSTALESQLKVANARYDADVARLMQQVDVLTQELKQERKAVKASAEKLSDTEKEFKTELERTRTALNAESSAKSTLEAALKAQLVSDIVFVASCIEDANAQIIREQARSVLRLMDLHFKELKEDPLLSMHLNKIQASVQAKA